MKEREKLQLPEKYNFFFPLSFLARKVVVVVDGWCGVVAVALLSGFFRGTVGPI